MAADPNSPVLNLESLELALEAAQLGEYEWHYGRRTFTVSLRMAQITGMAVGTFDIIDDNGFYDLVHPEDRQATRSQIEAALAAEGRYDVDFRGVRPDDGRVVWMRVSGIIQLDAQGDPIAVFGLVRDISARKAAEEQRIAVMAELDHRVKNVLSAVQALAQQTAKRTTSISGFLTTFSGRLKAMASANELLTAARWRGAAIAHLAAAELGGLAPGQTRWAGPDLFLTPRAANALALALHELVTNALKFGALSTDSGQVEVLWVPSIDGGFELTWTETSGPPVNPSPELGFGSTLLRQVTGRELGGEVEVDFRRSGVQVRLRAAASSLTEQTEPPGQGPQPRDVDVNLEPGDLSALKGARILIVEDAVLLALELETGLADAGAIIVGPAYELQDAMALLDGPIDVAVLDANLNGRDVSPVAKVLAERGVPFVFATGYGDTGGAPFGFDAPIIRKPYDVSQIAAAVATLLRAS